MTRKLFVRAAGYVFTWERDVSKPEVDVEVYREDASGRRRFFVTRTRSAPTREAVYARAMAVVAWIRALNVPARKDPQAQAVLEQLAITNDRMARLQARRPAVVFAIDQLLEGRTAAA